MGEAALVSGKHEEFVKFSRRLEASDLSPRAIILASYADSEDERLLIVPRTNRYDERDVYRMLSRLLSDDRAEFPSIDVSDFRVVSEEEPYVRALASVFRVDGGSTVSVQKSMLNGVYVEDVEIYRLNLER